VAGLIRRTQNRATEWVLVFIVASGNFLCNLARSIRQEPVYGNRMRRLRGMAEDCLRAALSISPAYYVSNDGKNVPHKKFHKSSHCAGPTFNAKIRWFSPAHFTCPCWSTGVARQSQNAMLTIQSQNEVAGHGEQTVARSFSKSDWVKDGTEPV
jgi:hypothetical protein